MTQNADNERTLTLTDAEWRDLAVVCRIWLDEHPQGVPLCRRIAHRIADSYTYEASHNGSSGA
jgi:hypothetical protein